MLAMLFNMGTTQTGRRAHGSSLIDGYLQSLQAMAGYIADVMNRFLIREWCGYYWGENTDMPTRVAGRIEPFDIPGLAAAVSAKLITVDIELENVLRSQLALPEKEETDEGPGESEPIDEGSAEIG